MEIRHLSLPVEMRKELASPLGELIEGSPEEVTPVLAQRLTEYKGLLITVGDVVSEMLLQSGVMPNLMVTDGKTKRQYVENVLSHEDYEEFITMNPAGEISEEAWGTLRYILESLNKDSRIHLIVDGEEDLLVLPIVLELGDEKEYTVIYGQPNEGAVLLTRTLSKRFLIEDIMDRMEIISDEYRDN